MSADAGSGVRRVSNTWWCGFSGDTEGGMEQAVGLAPIIKGETKL